MTGWRELEIVLTGACRLGVFGTFKERTKGLVTREMMMEDCLVFIDNLSVVSEIRIVATALITSSYF